MTTGSIGSSYYNCNKLFLSDIMAACEASKENCFNINNDTWVNNFSTLELATQNSVVFVNSRKYLPILSTTNAAVCICPIEILPELGAFNSKIAAVGVKNTDLAVAKILDSIYTKATDEESGDGKIASNAQVSKLAKIGKNVTIQSFVVIEKGCEVGDNCFIGSGSILKKGVKIGNNCTINSCCVLECCEIGNDAIIHNGAKIGQDGFGFVFDNSTGRIRKIIQLGGVKIGNRVEVGANSCIDRGRLGNTVIGDDCKIDNLVQVGHNVFLGKGVIMCGQSGVAGSTTIGDYSMIGGQAGIMDHVKVGKMAKIAAKSGVSSTLKDGDVVAGNPDMPIRTWNVINALLLRMYKDYVKGRSDGRSAKKGHEQSN